MSFSIMIKEKIVNKRLDSEVLIFQISHKRQYMPTSLQNLILYKTHENMLMAWLKHDLNRCKHVIKKL